ncbi:hypothetical protein ACFW04_013646 [Cataglyphis niger]
MQYIFLVLDAFTKYVNLYPMKKAIVHICLKKIIDSFVPKSRSVYYHGSQFTSAQWKTQLEIESIKVLYNSIRHSQSNPTERVMRELGRLSRTSCREKHTKWVEFIPKIEEILNITVHQSTGVAPYELQFGNFIQDEILKLQFPKREKPQQEYLIISTKENLKKNLKIVNNKK